MFTIIRDAGWPIWPLLATSFIALALIVERTLALRRSRVLPAEMLGEALSLAVRPQLTNDALAKLEAQAPLGRVLSAGLRHRNLKRTDLINAMEEAGRVSAHELHRYLGALGTIAAIAPLMGLFGTVIGMIEIFGAWSPTGGDPAQLARGISIALYNTALGILVAIPAVIFQRLFRARAADHLLEMEHTGMQLVDSIRPLPGQGS